MHGQDSDLVQIFRELGGRDPGVIEVLQSGVNDQFQRLPVGPGVDAARNVVASRDFAQSLAASKSVSVEDIAANPLAGVEGQALQTLAQFGR